jgi:hypothetical protein
LHGHSICSFFSDVTKGAHLRAAVGSGQAGRVAAFHVNASARAAGLPCSPSDFLGLELLEVGTPVHVARRTATVSAKQPKIVQDSIRLT